MEPACLSATDLACRRGDRLLFRGLSFELHEGEALQVAGPNGTGKSSLLRILAGLLRPEAGTVEREPLVQQRHFYTALNRTGQGPQEASEDANEAGLSGAVRPRDLQRLARVQLERQSAEQQPLAAAAGEVRRGKAGGFHGAPG